MREKWYENNIFVRRKPYEVIIKQYDQFGRVADSIRIPSVRFPLGDTLDSMEIFSASNTQVVQNKQILDIFDKVVYKVGHCYQNTQNLTAHLRDAEFKVRTYAGWLFTSPYDYPIHHCWCMIGDSILDLGDDFTTMLSGENGKHFEGKNKEETIELIADFAKAAANVPNQIRCAPVGQPTSFLFYVGYQCDPEDARKAYRRLMEKFPDHECERNVDEEGYNKTQRKLKSVGLME